MESEECSSIRISTFWRKNKCRQEKGSQISVFKPKRLQISSHSPTLNFTGKELRLKYLRVSDRVSPESRGSQQWPHTIIWEIFKNNNAQALLWTK